MSLHSSCDAPRFGGALSESSNSETEDFGSELSAARTAVCAILPSTGTSITRFHTFVIRLHEQMDELTRSISMHGCCATYTQTYSKGPSSFTLYVQPAFKPSIEHSYTPLLPRTKKRNGELTLAALVSVFTMAKPANSPQGATYRRYLQTNLTVLRFCEATIIAHDRRARSTPSSSSASARDVPVCLRYNSVSLTFPQEMPRGFGLLQVPDKSAREMGQFSAMGFTRD